MMMAATDAGPKFTRAAGQRAWAGIALILALFAALPATLPGSEPSTTPTTPPSPSAPPAPAASAEAGSINWDEARQFWSFQPPKRHAPPAVLNADWPRQPLDYFILHRMELAGLKPSPEAARRTWVRRAAFTLTGLPPAPEEVEAFVADDEPGAYERWVDRLLGSPEFGERMASLWLNAARYAEDQAHQVGDDTTHFYPNAFLYRQWVINAFNADMPYDRFIRLQLAADVIAAGDTNALVALGFLGVGPKYYNRGQLEVMADEWEDRVDTVCRTFQGLTVACARCHDHKFDPIQMEDYYALAGVFASTKMLNRPMDKSEADAAANVPEDPDKKPDKKSKPDNTRAMHIIEDGDVKNLNVFVRGDVSNKGPEVPRRFLRVLCGGEPAPFTEGSGRRELADAMADPANPLTARVMVNRLWQMVFGAPLVATPENFGHMGERPSHPELLDDLAVRMMEGGWTMKRMIREMMLSATYRQASAGGGDRVKIDPENRHWSRMNRQRMPVEMWRDSVLLVSGDLAREGGKSLELDDPSNLRRTVYGRVSRLKLNDLLMLFDYPDANVHSSKRSTTVTPTQKLFVMNSEFMMSRARGLAGRLSAETGGDPRARVVRAYELLYGRPPTGDEIALGLEFVGGEGPAGYDRWAQYAQALMAANEMMYVD